MSEDLNEQAAIVVGASSGMGRATAKTLARAGMSVMAAARREDRLQELQKELSREKQTVEIRATDSAHQADVEQLIEQTMQRFGRIDLLVYATGTNIPDRSLDVLTPETWNMMLQTNLTGAFLCTRAVLSPMRKAGSGLIVYLSSAAVQMPDVSGVAYQASKHGLAGLAHGTRVEEKNNGIRTTVIYPGLCDTEILQKRPTATPREVLDLALDPVDVAETILYLSRMSSRSVVPELQLLPSRL